MNYKKLIDKVVWWIPIRKHRDNLRLLFYNLEDKIMIYKEKIDIIELQLILNNKNLNKKDSRKIIFLKNTNFFIDNNIYYLFNNFFYFLIEDICNKRNIKFNANKIRSRY